MHDDTEQALGELQRSVERLQELLEEVLDKASQEKMGQAQEVADKLEAEIKELKNRDTEMKDLACCEDHIHYLQVGSLKHFHFHSMVQIRKGVSSSDIPLQHHSRLNPCQLWVVNELLSL